MPILYYGSCLCGQIRYQVKAFEPYQVHCHCSMCRRFHGAAFASLAEVRNENFTLLQGTERLQTYQAENGTVREFCSCCGSSLTLRSQPETLELALGTLDDEFAADFKANIYVSSKANWLELDASLPSCVQDWDELAGCCGGLSDKPSDTNSVYQSMLSGQSRVVKDQRITLHP